MSRYKMTQDQVNSLDDSSAQALLVEVQDSLDQLGQLEWQLYTRKRRKDVQNDPSLLAANSRKPPENSPAGSRKSNNRLVAKILKAAEEQGVSLDKLMEEK